MNDDTMLGRGATAAFATRKPCKHGSLICFECEPIKEPTMTTKTDALTRAIEYLGAVEVAPGRYAWHDKRPQYDCYVTADARGLEGTAWSWPCTDVVPMPSWWTPECQFAIAYDDGARSTYPTREKVLKIIETSGGIVSGHRVTAVTADLETGEELEQRALDVYTQGDPRGWPLRLLRPGDNPDASADGIGVPV